MTAQPSITTSGTKATPPRHKARPGRPARRPRRTEFDVHSWYERYHAEHARNDSRLAGVPFN